MSPSIALAGAIRIEAKTAAACLNGHGIEPLSHRLANVAGIISNEQHGHGGQPTGIPGGADANRPVIAIIGGLPCLWLYVRLPAMPH